jgi:hypothetical protein
MYFLYIDETGTSHQNKHFILGGAIINIKDWKKINKEITDLKSKYFQSVYVDLKGLRRKNYEFLWNKRKNYFYKMNEVQMKEFSDQLFDIIFSSQITFLASIINKEKHFQKYSNPINPYLLSYQFIVERFDNFLKDKNDFGSIYLESGNESLKSNLEEAHASYVSSGTAFQKIGQIIESCHFVVGPNNNFAQIADLFINAVYKAVEYSDIKYYEKYKPFIYCDEKGERIGYGIKYFPPGEKIIVY